ncbi:MAG: TIGR02996 domain-containing protein [Planctomycetes bacterium]|nr:TIGR02996 domain-containing protein [Planctomycetota bacterium]
MTPDNPFLRALLAEPDDDTLRLAMADWLDENEQPERAEFVRVQIELARGAPDRDRKRLLKLRQVQLLSARGREWIVPLGFGSDAIRSCQVVFRRGFVEYLRLPVHALLKDGARLVRLTPVRELDLELSDDVRDGSLRELLPLPWLRSITHLSAGRLSDSLAEEMIACPHLIGLRVLRCHWKHLGAVTRRRFARRFKHALPE